MTDNDLTEEYFIDYFPTVIYILWKFLFTFIPIII